MVHVTFRHWRLSRVMFLVRLQVSPTPSSQYSYMEQNTLNNQWVRLKNGIFWKATFVHAFQSCCLIVSEKDASLYFASYHLPATKVHILISSTFRVVVLWNLFERGVATNAWNMIPVFLLWQKQDVAASFLCSDYCLHVLGFRSVCSCRISPAPLLCFVLFCNFVRACTGPFVKSNHSDIPSPTGSTYQIKSVVPTWQDPLRSRPPNIEMYTTTRCRAPAFHAGRGWNLRTSARATQGVQKEYSWEWTRNFRAQVGDLIARHWRIAVKTQKLSSMGPLEETSRCFFVHFSMVWNLDSMLVADTLIR